MSLEQKINYDFNVFIEMGKHFDFLKVKTKRKGTDHNEGMAINLFSYYVEASFPVKRKLSLPDGRVVISASSNASNEIYSTSFINLFDFTEKINAFNELYKSFEEIYTPYLKSQCARVEGSKLAPDVKINPFPPQSELDESKRIFLEKVGELKREYASKFT